MSLGLRKNPAGINQTAPARGGFTRHEVRQVACALVGALLFCLLPASFHAQDSRDEIREINDEFHFLGPDDTLLIHEEDGKLKGQIDVYGGDEESDAILSFLITIGTRDKNHVEFKTSKIHEKYYRFFGAVEHGTGKKDGDRDYLRLVGEVKVTTVNGSTGEESTESKRVVLKSLGEDEIQDY